MRQIGQESDSMAAPDAPPRLPFAGSVEDEARLAVANAAAWRLLDERRRDPDRPSSSRGYRRLSDDKVSPTDPDATPMRRFTGDLPTLGYHDHYVIDGGKARIILAALVTPADVMDNTPCGPRRVRVPPGTAADVRARQIHRGCGRLPRRPGGVLGVPGPHGVYR
ncbi:MAG TPA: hypothetical protein VHG52_07845 [Thermomicrobiales bacterium]|nr:hypothetical protein [Thermomicrobiales bacterium]